MGTSTGATYQLQLLPVRLGGLEKRWVRTKPFQFHSHDVRAVAHSPTALISGGRAVLAPGRAGSPLPGKAWLICAWLPGLDAQLVIRPLMEKMQKKSYDAVLRKFTFPHVSGACAGVPELVGLAGLDLPALPGALVALPGFLPCPWLPPLPCCVCFPGTSEGSAKEQCKLSSWSCWSCWVSISRLPSHGS